jgi:hypothetical protein
MKDSSSEDPSEIILMTGFESAHLDDECAIRKLLTMDNAEQILSDLRALRSSKRLQGYCENERAAFFITFDASTRRVTLVVVYNISFPQAKKIVATCKDIPISTLNQTSLITAVERALGCIACTPPEGDEEQDIDESSIKRILIANRDTWFLSKRHTSREHRTSDLYVLKCLVPDHLLKEVAALPYPSEIPELLWDQIRAVASTKQ